MRGSLETMSVAELCMQLGGQGMSGTLTMESEGQTGKIAFDGGAIVWANSPSRGARIGDRLVHAGLLDPYYVDQAAQAQREAPQGTGIAALLVDRGLISADAARVFLQEQMIDALTDLLGWRTGSFELSDAPPPVVRLEVSVPTEALLTEVRRRLAEQERVRTVVTSLELVPSVTNHRPEALPLDESVVLREIDGSRTVHQLAGGLGFGDNELRRIVYGLTLLDAVTLDGVVVARDDDPLDEVEHAIEDSLDEALSGHVSDDASDELSSLLEDLLHTPAGDTGSEVEAEPRDESAVDADDDIGPSDDRIDEALAPDEAVVIEPVVDDEPVTAEVATTEGDVDDGPGAAMSETPGVSRIESGRFDETDVDEPRPWVGYATAKPGTTPPRRPSPAAPPADDLAFIATPTEKPTPDVAEPASAEPAPAETPGDTDESDELFPEPVAPSPASAGDDLSALLAELSSLSNEDEPADRPDAAPPRKPASGQDDRDKDPKKRRLFGR